MKNLVLGAVSCLALSGAAYAEPPMWRVSDADSEIYLFGSVHVLKPTTQWRTDALDAVIETADEIYFELPMTAEAQAAGQALVPQYGVDVSTPLSSKLDAEQNEQLARVAGQFGLPATQLEPLQPWLVSITLSMLTLQAQGYDPLSGVELTLAGEIDDSRERFVETYADQLGFFANLSPDVQVEFLDITMDAIEEDPAGLDPIVDAWESGDIDTLDTLFHEGMRASGDEVYNALILYRNENWVGQIEAMMAGSGETLMVVGAGHLVGENGVPNMLVERGYTVERVQ